MTGQVRAEYSITDGSAKADSDFTAAMGSVTFPDGDYSPKTFTVPILNDGILEAKETATLELKNPQGGASLGARSSAVLYIYGKCSQQRTARILGF
jgi:hypothetical protein